MTSLAAAVAATRPLVESLFDQLRNATLDEPGVTRAPYGQGESFAHRLLAGAARDLGLEVSQDAARNTYLTLPGRDRAAPVLMTGSHLDSVAHGGNFDGAAGVVGGLAAVMALRTMRPVPERDVTVMAIRAEESVWFQVSYIGSRAAFGVLPQGVLDSATRIDSGRSLAWHMQEEGADLAALRTGARHLDPARVAGFVELHIEQAPSLVKAGRPIAIGTGIPGNFRYPDIIVTGEQAHVGLPRRFRQDAALAGADFATGLDRIWAEKETAGIPMAATIGRFHTDAALHGMTSVPGRFLLSLDVRAYDEAVLAGLEKQVLELVAEIEARRGVRFALGARASAPVGPVAPAIRDCLERQAVAQGLDWQLLGSPASHDAATFAAMGVPMGMIFVRNVNGSHNPDEAMEIDDLMAGIGVLAGWMVEASA
ncbi:Zn-dependent hydrolase [Roseomonas marmotae]|uniref:Zn-dependent hydrolase n=1 Tax=Roseomonas marmotae TaxID=2768161 RepID=A0ABS3KIP4_9PROT|nr:Zn-dependent hydrolase [Roseomonas marmotae]MBO1077333.1 Zn-dependent hydrolase [Roseomonas marmotae]QTI81150.1 Zn-dependent hydrolase [Roseomonas marmotae]